jgi:PBP1b-binding outer membrane lipoprotein LpoB
MFYLINKFRTFFMRSFFFVGIVLALIFLVACTPNFIRPEVYNLQTQKLIPQEKPIAVISSFNINVPRDHFYSVSNLDSVRTNFANAIYNSGQFKKVYTYLPLGLDSLRSQDIIYFDITLSPEFTQDINWLFSFPMVFTSGLWPLQPRKGEVKISAKSVVQRGSTTLKVLEFYESEPFDMTWYGLYRQWHVQNIVKEVYTKLHTRLSSLVSDNIQFGGLQEPISGIDPNPFSNQVAQLQDSLNNAPVNSMIISAAPEPLHLNSKSNVAVLELAGESITKSEASTLTMKLSGELMESGRYNIMERSQMNSILLEQGFQQTGCVSDACMVEMGQLIGVDKLVAGSVGRVGDVWLISLRLIDVQTGMILKSSNHEIKGDISLLLTEGIRKAVAKLNY